MIKIDNLKFEKEIETIYKYPQNKPDVFSYNSDNYKIIRSDITFKYDVIDKLKDEIYSLNIELYNDPNNYDTYIKKITQLKDELNNYINDNDNNYHIDPRYIKFDNDYIIALDSNINVKDLDLDYKSKKNKTINVNIKKEKLKEDLDLTLKSEPIKKDLDLDLELKSEPIKELKSKSIKEDLDLELELKSKSESVKDDIIKEPIKTSDIKTLIDILTKNDIKKSSIKSYLGKNLVFNNKFKKLCKTYDISDEELIKILKNNL